MLLKMNKFVPWETGCKYITFLKHKEMRKKKSGPPEPFSSFTEILIDWYEKHKRDLPFRGTRNPYLIWVSEVILQQTRMDQGIGYYNRFVDRFPDLISLAEADEEEVLRLWQGLGYYSRARHMHEAARDIVRSDTPTFPDHYEKILAMKGVGEYSAASIASLAFDEPHPAIDGNVFRFLARLYGFDEPANTPASRKWALAHAAALMDPERPGQFNQAMIEFGALVCTPRNPRCTECPVQDSCISFRNGLVSRIPVRAKPASQRVRHFHYLLVVFSKEGVPFFLAQKRTGADIWKNLYELPLIETGQETDLSGLMVSGRFKTFFTGIRPVFRKKFPEIRHQLSHQLIRISFYQFYLPDEPDTGLVSLAAAAIDTLPFPRPVSRFLVSLSPDDWM